MYSPSADSDYDAERVVKRLLGGKHPDGCPAVLPGNFVDCAGYTKNPPETEQVQGLFRYTAWKDGDLPVTCLATRDRTADQRYASNSQFWVLGTDDVVEAQRLTRTAFPQQWARIDAAGTPESRRAPHEAILRDAGLTPLVAASLGYHQLVEVADVIRALKG